MTELLATMPAWEFDAWRHYYRKNGFPIDRQVGATARAGSAICGTWGGDVPPADLIPKFVPIGIRRSAKRLLSYAMSIPGAQVTRHGR